MNKPLSVVIPVYNSSESLRRQLEALSRQSTSVDFEVIVSDNNSKDNLDEVVKDFDGILNIRTVNAFAVQGQSYARNYAVAESSADFILFCDADDIVSSGWVEAHFRQFEELSADITTGPAYNFIQYSDLDDYILPVEDYEGMQILENESKRYFSIIGCSFGIRKEKFILSGGFDESLLGGGEDIDLGIRVQKLGAKVSKARNAFIFKK